MVLVGPCQNTADPMTTAFANSLDEAINACNQKIRNACREQNQLQDSEHQERQKFAGRRAEMVARFEEQY